MAVLERVDDRSQRALVQTRCAPLIDRARGSTAARASDAGGGAPGGQRLTADFTIGRRDELNVLPAGGADRAVRWALERGLAGSAGGGENDRKEGVRYNAIRSAFPQSRSRL